MSDTAWWMNRFFGLIFGSIGLHSPLTFNQCCYVSDNGTCFPYSECGAIVGGKLTISGVAPFPAGTSLCSGYSPATCCSSGCGSIDGLYYLAFSPSSPFLTNLPETCSLVGSSDLTGCCSGGTALQHYIGILRTKDDVYVLGGTNSGSAGRFFYGAKKYFPPNAYTNFCNDFYGSGVVIPTMEHSGMVTHVDAAGNLCCCDLSSATITLQADV